MKVHCIVQEKTDYRIYLKNTTTGHREFIYSGNFIACLKKCQKLNKILAQKEGLA